MPAEHEDTPRAFTTPIRVVIADDHALLRGGVRALLARMPDIEVVGEATNGQQALALARSESVDVILMDISMAGMNGLDATARLLKECPHVRIVILSIHDEREYVQRALDAGATGYVLKDGDPTDLVLSVRAVARGETYLGAGVSRRVGSPTT